MNKFNLERALAGEKVITRDGREASQFKTFHSTNGAKVACVIDGFIVVFLGNDGVAKHDNNLDLFMAPKKLSGFVNVYRNGEGDVYLGSIRNTEEECRLDIRQATHKVLMHLDLSQFDEGHGL